MKQEFFMPSFEKKDLPSLYGVLFSLNYLGIRVSSNLR